MAACTEASPAQDHTAHLAEAVRAAAADHQPLALVGAGTKSFLGHRVEATPLAVGAHRGVVHYEPTELVVTARAGTTLEDLDTLLAEHGQALPFEPPRLGPGATLGGTIACGLSGPGRPWIGAARDFVLGLRMVNGRGQVLRFGGEVMKNVAGFDVSRLMTGAMGTLGVILEVSLKVLPRPAREVTLRFELDVARAIERVNAWSARPLPLSGACHLDGTLHLRLSGTPQGVASAAALLGGEEWPDGARFWTELREQRLPFFEAVPTLWRIAVPANTKVLDLPGQVIHDWGGMLRWLASDAPPSRVREVVEAAGGHATVFRSGAQPLAERFHPLTPAQRTLHARIKDAFDPAHILNPGRMYPDL